MPEDKNQWLPSAAFVVAVVAAICGGIQAWEVLDRHGLVWGAVAISADVLIFGAVVWSIVYNIRSGRQALNKQAQTDNKSAQRIAELINELGEEQHKNANLTKQLEAQKTFPQTRTVTVAQPVTKEKLSPRVEITSPKLGDDVFVYEMVTGTVIPAYSTVQLCVLARNGIYYLQGEAQADGMSWHLRCQFGRPDMDFGSTYDIMAFHGTPLKESEFKKLPVGVKPAHSIQVRRKTEG
jgi:hypothetical protein